MIWFIATSAIAQVVTYDEDLQVDLTGRALAILGAVDESASSADGRVELGVSVDAEFGAYVECGAIKFEGDFQAVMPDVSKVPEELVLAGGALVSALPMLTLCHTSPSLCAELKNLNFRVDEQWDFQADLCKSMNNYIDDQAAEGERMARGRYMTRCVNQLSGEQVPEASRMDPAAAQLRCLEQDEPYLNVDIAQGYLTHAISSGPQKVFKQALAASQTELSKKPEFYEWLTAIGGEMEVRHNGQIMPLFPESGNLLAQELAESLERAGYRIARSSELVDLVGRVEGGKLVPGEIPSAGSMGSLAGVDTGDDAAKYWLNRMFYVFSTEFTLRDYQNLHDLDTAVAFSMTRHWGKVVSMETIVRLEAEMDSELTHVEKNPALPEIGKKQAKSVRRTIEVVRKYFAEDDIPSISEFRLQLENAAEATRRRNRTTAGVLAEGEEINRKNQADRPPCSSFQTCGGR